MTRRGLLDGFLERFPPERRKEIANQVYAGLVLVALAAALGVAIKWGTPRLALTLEIEWSAALGWTLFTCLALFNAVFFGRRALLYGRVSLEVVPYSGAECGLIICNRGRQSAQVSALVRVESASWGHVKTDPFQLSWKGHKGKSVVIPPEGYEKIVLGQFAAQAPFMDVVYTTLIPGATEHARWSWTKDRRNQLVIGAIVEIQSVPANSAPIQRYTLVVEQENGSIDLLSRVDDD